MTADKLEELTDSGDLVQDLQNMRAYYVDLYERLEERPWTVNMDAQDAFDRFIRDIDTVLEDYEDE